MVCCKTICVFAVYFLWAAVGMLVRLLKVLVHGSVRTICIAEGVRALRDGDVLTAPHPRKALVQAIVLPDLHRL